MKCSTNVLRAPCSVFRKIKTHAIFILIGALCTVHGERLNACPLCKEALTQGMAKGFYWSILLMLTVPAVVVGVIAGALWRAGRKRRGLPGSHHE